MRSESTRFLGQPRLMKAKVLGAMNPVRAPEGRRALAALVLHQGLDGLVRGEGPAECVVVDADPTLDDLLAATFAARLAEQRPLPEGARAFAEYAALVREGLTSNDVPLE